jgi:glutamine cyclotransferase
MKTIRYDGEGWGVCFDGEYLYMTNGSDSLYWRNPESFDVRGVHQVTSGGSPVRNLNELECVGDYVYANVYQEDRIVQIEKTSGRVVRNIDALRLRLMSGAPADGEAVLNGIAYDPRNDVFFLTGKLWPAMYVVRFVGAGSD